MANLTLKEWVEKYKPLRNDNGDIIALETYGKYMDYIKKQDETHIWTLGNAEGESYICAGRSWINRLSYFVTEIPWESWGEYVVLDDDDDVDIFYSL